MPDVFISYARSTGAAASGIADALRGAGYDVWEDNALPPHRSYADVISEQLIAAKAVLVVWSDDATRSQWVRSEANRAREAGKLVQLRLDRCQLPMPFDQISCADLTTWNGVADGPEWAKVLASVDQLMAALPTDAMLPEAFPRNDHGPDLQEQPGALPERIVRERSSIAVLPFRNLSGDPEQDYFAYAMTEDVATALSRWRWFFVVALESSARYGGELDLSRVGRELGVRYLVQGTVRKLPERARLTVKLTETATGACIWAEQFDRELADILSLQDTITTEVVAAIEPAMLNGESLRVSRRSPVDFTAVDCFYRGMWQLNKLTKGGDDQAHALFDEAVRLDPDLSLGHIGLARVFYGQAIFGFDSDPTAVLRKSGDAALRAIALDPSDACGYFALAGAALYLGDHDAALDAARQAVGLNPNFAYAHYRLGQVLIFSGRAEAAIEPIEHSLHLSPRDPQMASMRDTLALAYYHAGRYEAAVEQARSSASPFESHGSSVLAASLARLGRRQDAATAYARARQAPLSPRRPRAAPYADPRQLQDLRDAFRLAGAGSG